MKVIQMEKEKRKVGRKEEFNSRTEEGDEKRNEVGKDKKEERKDKRRRKVKKEGIKVGQKERKEKLAFSFKCSVKTGEMLLI